MKVRQRGFSLIEAIVAMVLIGSLGMAIFGWVNSQLSALAHVKDASARSRATASVLEYLNVVNPMLTPEGKADLGEFKFNWKSRPVEEPMDGANYPAGISLYRIGLYKMTLDVRNPDNTAWFSFEVDQVGYKKVREMMNFFG